MQEEDSPLRWLFHSERKLGDDCACTEGGDPPSWRHSSPFSSAYLKSLPSGYLVGEPRNLTLKVLFSVMIRYHLYAQICL